MGTMSFQSGSVGKPRRGRQPPAPASSLLTPEQPVPSTGLKDLETHARRQHDFNQRVGLSLPCVHPGTPARPECVGTKLPACACGRSGIKLVWEELAVEDTVVHFLNKPRGGVLVSVSASYVLLVLGPATLDPDGSAPSRGASAAGAPTRCVHLS